MYMHKIQSKFTMQYQQCALLQDPSAHWFVKTNKQIATVLSVYIKHSLDVV